MSLCYQSTLYKMLGCLLTLMLAVPSLQSELKILSTPDGSTHPTPCALTCTGVSKYDETGHYNWRQWHQHVYKYVKIEDCGFVAPPIITATLKGAYWSVRCPSIYLQLVGYTAFFALSVEETTVSQLTDNKCDVHWTANGYNC